MWTSIGTVYNSLPCSAAAGHCCAHSFLAAPLPTWITVGACLWPFTPPEVSRVRSGPLLATLSSRWTWYEEEKERTSWISVLIHSVMQITFTLIPWLFCKVSSPIHEFPTSIHDRSTSIHAFFESDSRVSYFDPWPFDFDSRFFRVCFTSFLLPPMSVRLRFPSLWLQFINRSRGDH